MFGLVNSCVSIGALSGPATAGVLLELTGYWFTWGTVFAVILLDIGMRVVMLEKPKKLETDTSTSENPEEGSALSPDAPVRTYGSVKQDPTVKEISTLFFYKVMLSQPRVLVGLSCSVVFSSMLASYGTTVPTHVKFAFGWGSLPAGLLFAAIEGPTIVMSPFFGWLRDRVGTGRPAGTGFILLAPLVWLLGAADQKQFPWAVTEDSAKHTYIAAAVGIGLVTNLMAGVGTVEITYAIDELESAQPGIFGPNGGYSRSYSLSNLAFATVLGELKTSSPRLRKEDE
ncbi:hypothetical protein ABW21_db0206472 [Orbilia brochopaga]|nr:hypothetical protein ABW21_db0206472 [Drechslerella brochopaga]